MTAVATEGGLPSQFPPPSLKALLPYRWAGDLIPTFAAAMCFLRHAKGRLSRPGIRRGAVARITKRSFGVGADVFARRTRNFLTRLVRYGRVTCGSGEFGGGVRKLEVLHANVPARPIAGIGRSAWLAARRKAAGVQSFRNLYICQRSRTIRTRSMTRPGANWASLLASRAPGYCPHRRGKSFRTWAPWGTQVI